MRTTLFIPAALFFFLLSLAACGGRGDGSAGGRDMGPLHDGGAHDMSGSSTDMGGGGHDSGSTIDMGGTSTDGGTHSDAAMCVPHCTIDFDCQHSCPAMAGRVQCCDRASGTCFGTSGSVCPSGGTDGGSGSDGSMY